MNAYKKRLEILKAKLLATDKIFTPFSTARHLLETNIYTLDARVLLTCQLQYHTFHVYSTRAVCLQTFQVDKWVGPIPVKMQVVAIQFLCLMYQLMKDYVV